MSIGQTLAAVIALEQQGVIRRYAIAGAVAALNYIEPTLTDDLDVLISIDGLETAKGGLILLAPIEKALAEMGHRERAAAGIVVAGWPVQFLPVASALDEEALAGATEVEIDVPDHPGLRVRCLSAEHVVATALKVGRLKDWARIEAFLTQDAVDLSRLRGVLERHGLMSAWTAFCAKAGLKDPLAVD